MYDVTNPESFKKVRDWVKELNKMLGINNIRLAIIGNKIDLLTLGEQKCPQNNALIHEAMQFTNELMNARHYLTSAKLNQGVSELFTSLSKRIIEQTAKQQSPSRETNNRFASGRSLSMMDDQQADNERRMLSRKAYGSRIDLSNVNSSSNKRPPTSSTCNC